MQEVQAGCGLVVGGAEVGGAGDGGKGWAGEGVARCNAHGRHHQPQQQAQQRVAAVHEQHKAGECEALSQRQQLPPEEPAHVPGKGVK